MTQDEIIEFGKQAGLEAFNYPEFITEDAWEKIEAFAKLVTAKERDELLLLSTKAHDVDGNCSIVLAADIRARGEA